MTKCSVEKYIETRRHVSIQITYMWRVRWKYRGDINAKFKAKSLQYYTGYQKGIKKWTNENQAICVLIIFCNLNHNKSLCSRLYKVCWLFLLFFNSKMGLELTANAKFDALHSHSLLALQVASVSIAGYTTWEQTVYPRSDHLFRW